MTFSVYDDRGVYYVFDVTIKDPYGNPRPDRVWVSEKSQEAARLAALATWPDIQDIKFVKKVYD